MAVTTRGLAVAARGARAERILDAAAELLLRWGYKRVTVDDVAVQAGIGKGTIYLHWTTREALFQALLQRELAGAIDQLLAAVRADPQTALLHRLVSTWFVTVGQRPLIRAAVLADLEVLGKMAKRADQQIEKHLLGAFDSYLRLSLDHGLLHAGLSHEDLVYALRATVRGFFLTEALDLDPASMDLARTAELLSGTLQRAFGVDASPPQEILGALAPLVINLFGGIADHLRAQLRQAYE
jgi:AcrR family transcriptional regulator